MQRVVGFGADACKTSLLFAWQILVEKCERGAGAILAEGFRADAPHFFLVSCFSRSRRQITEHLPASVFDHPFRHVQGVGQHAAHTGRCHPESGCTKTRSSTPRGSCLRWNVNSWWVSVLIGWPCCKDRVEQRSDEIPRLGKHLAATATQRPRVLCSDHHPVGIVVEHRVVRAPGNEHRIPGAEHDAHAGSQRLRPLLHGAQHGRRPVDGAHSCAHLAAAGEYRLDQLRLAEIHRRLPP